jgi:hypothetical protein
MAKSQSRKRPHDAASPTPAQKISDTPCNGSCGRCQACKDDFFFSAICEEVDPVGDEWLQ